MISPRLLVITVAWVLREAPKLAKDIKIVVNVSGRGDKDADYVAAKLGLN